MKNLSILLDQKTILNFGFLTKLLKRYFLISILVPLITGGIAAYIYSTQSDVFSIARGVQVKVNKGSNQPSDKLNSILGGGRESLSIAEALSIGKTIDFREKVADKIINHPDFLKFNFNHTGSKKPKSHEAIFQNCAGEVECLKSIVVTRLAGYYSIVRHQMIPNKYVVSIKTLDGFTSRKLLELVTEEIVVTHEEDILSSHLEQVKMSEKLISKKKNELKGINLIELQDSLRVKTEAIQGVLVSFNSYTGILRSQKLQLNKAMLTVQETKNTVGKATSAKDRKKINKYQKLKRQVSDLYSNVRTLELASNELSREDKLIIGQLKQEIKGKEAELNTLGRFDRLYANTEEFKKIKDKTSNFDSFNSNVLKGQIEDTKLELSRLEGTLKVLELERLAIENKLKSLKPSFDYLKLLETKQVELELLRWTIGNDLVIDKKIGNIHQFKRTSIPKIILYSLIMTLFILLVGIVTLYAFDERVYDEYELKSNFKNLDVIGNTPDFES